MSFGHKVVLVLRASMNDSLPLLARMGWVLGVVGLGFVAAGVALAARLAVAGRYAEALAWLALLPTWVLCWSQAWRTAVDVRMGLHWARAPWVGRVTMTSFGAAGVVLGIGHKWSQALFFGGLAAVVWWLDRKSGGGGGGDGWDDPVLGPQPDPGAQA